MKKRLTENAVVAQMVADAISNDYRRVNGVTHSDTVLERAKLWYSRANMLMKARDSFYYDNLLQNGFEGFLCSMESNLGILDFWDGDVVDFQDKRGTVRTGVVRSVKVAATSYGGGHADVVFTDGSGMYCGWKDLYHAVVPQSILDIAKTQLAASGKCPFLK